MNAAFRIQRGDDMPMIGRIIRERKGQYAVIIKFAKSERHYQDEVVFAPNVKAVKAHLHMLYSNISFGERKRKKK